MKFSLDRHSCSAICGSTTCSAGLSTRPCRTDGEPLEFITVHFQLVSNSNLPAIRAALDDLPPLRKEGDAFWNWVAEKALHRKFAEG